MKNIHMLRLKSKPESISKVEIYVKEIARRYAIKPDVYPNILISLTEAVNNAICHGNCYDTDKYVQINMEKKSNIIALRVSDQGRGFDPKSIPDPTIDENVSKIGGRGVFLIRQLSDQVSYVDDGRTVLMKFKL